MSFYGKLCWGLVLCLLFAGCGGGYQLQRSNGVETLFHVSENGHIRMIYRVEHGQVDIHDGDDPEAKAYMARLRNAAQLREKRSQSSKRDLDPAAARRAARIKAATKRNSATPIFTFVHIPKLDANLYGSTETAEHSRHRMQSLMAKTMGSDQTIRITPLEADVEVFARGYVKKTRAFNIRTRKHVMTNAFHFEVDVQSNYLPEDRFRIVEAGHWMDNQWVIQRAAMRAGKILIDRIGPHIPAQRERFLKWPNESKAGPGF